MSGGTLSPPGPVPVEPGRTDPRARRAGSCFRTYVPHYGLKRRVASGEAESMSRRTANCAGRLYVVERYAAWLPGYFSALGVQAVFLRFREDCFAR